jgi:hypothetical protein
MGIAIYPPQGMNCPAAAVARFTSSAEGAAS